MGESANVRIPTAIKNLQFAICNLQSKPTEISQGMPALAQRRFESRVVERDFLPHDPNKSLQATAGSGGF